MIRKNDRMKKISKKVLLSNPVQVQQPTAFSQQNNVRSTADMMQGLPQANLPY
jgi:hypothetical protein